MWECEEKGEGRMSVNEVGEVRDRMRSRYEPEKRDWQATEHILTY